METRRKKKVERIFMRRSGLATTAAATKTAGVLFFSLVDDASKNESLFQLAAAAADRRHIGVRTGKGSLFVWQQGGRSKTFHQDDTAAL
jgi:hypothetical protein